MRLNQIKIPNEKYITVCVRASVAGTDTDTVYIVFESCWAVEPVLLSSVERWLWFVTSMLCFKRCVIFVSTRLRKQHVMRCFCPCSLINVLKLTAHPQTVIHTHTRKHINIAPSRKNTPASGSVISLTYIIKQFLLKLNVNTVTFWCFLQCLLLTVDQASLCDCVSDSFEPTESCHNVTSLLVLVWHVLHLLHW